jgi:hypothetical protein
MEINKRRDGSRDRFRFERFEMLKQVFPQGHALDWMRLTIVGRV